MLRTVRHVLTITCVAAATLVAPPLSQAAEVESVHDGTSQATAAASCWEIKQEVPSSTDGVYWLLTPQLATPTQFHCDMTTDGGGWVLVGRGRDGWKWDGDAQGTPEEIATTPTGPGAFSPRKLSSSTIDALLAGTRVDQLAEGIRLHRATDASGSSWQDVTFSMRSADRWSWAFGGGMPLTSASFGGTTYSGSTSRDFGTQSTFGSDAYRRVWTWESSMNGWVRGFNHGYGVVGTTSASSYLYATGDRYATPFTQVFVRPRVRTQDLTFAAVRSTGTKAVTQLPVARSGALDSPWGVTGTGTGGTGELATEVQAFAQIGGVMYVGGNFTTVRNQSGSRSVPQSYLAAFDASSGEWISDFRPRLDGQVRALVALPDGRLAVGGEFAQVDGQAHRGLVVMDVATGAPDPSWSTQVENRLSGGTVSVRALDVSKGQLYLGGAFSHVVQGPREWYNRNAGRIRISDGLGGAWNPDLNGAVADLDVDDAGSRVYYAGYMTAAGGVTVRKGAAISTASGAAVVPWSPLYSTTTPATYQQAVKQVKQKVWLGGAQHSMFAYDRSTLELENTHLTRSGGDLQAIASNGKVVYGGCHCGDWSYTDARNYDSYGTGSTTVDWSRVDKISLLGAWNAATGEYVNTFAPQWKSRGGYGVWAIEVADDGTVWAGGSLETVVKENGSNQWSGGFARFAQRPATAPASPTGAAATIESDKATLTWSASPTPGVTYQVMRGSRAVATTRSTSISVPGSRASDRFMVRAGDGHGNWSASTAPIRPTVRTTLLAGGAEWSYWSSQTDPVAATWRRTTFDDSAWRRGRAPLGWGHASVATTFPVADRAIATYLRRDVRIADVDAFGTYLLTTRADDGVVVYVNGTRVARANMPAQAPTGGTYATAAPRTAQALDGLVQVEVPASLLRDGVNTVMAEVHANYRDTPDLTFAASLVATR